MKRFLTILLTTLALAGLLCVTASAASFDGPAAELAAIGMLKGSASEGFALDKAPTRTQAAIMLVRLFGAEEEAKAAYAAGELTCPFTDVDETAAPFAAWLADKGLISGTSASVFGGGDLCTGKAYTIFLLRALGYRDNVDFTSANAQEFAMSLGLLDTSLLTGEFLRDDLVALTYQALGMDLKGGGAYLLDSLVESGVVSAAAARPILDKIEAYRALSAAGADTARGLDAAVDAKMSMAVGLKGRESGEAFEMAQKMDASVQGDIQMVLDKAPQMALDMTVTLNDGGEVQTGRAEYWMKDGVTYVRSGGEAYQIPSGMGMDMEAFMALMEQSSGQTGPAMLPFIDSITTKASGENTVYILRLNDAFGQMMNGILGQVLDTMPAGLDMRMGLEAGAITYTVDPSGQLKNAAVNIAMKASMDAAEGADRVSLTFSADMVMTMDVKTMGPAVNIRFPDPSGFEKIIGGADGLTGISGTWIS